MPTRRREARPARPPSCARIRRCSHRAGRILAANEAAAHFFGYAAPELRQVLTNFVANAIKFTEHGGIEVRITAPGEGRVAVAVVDTGPGIDEEPQRRLFLPFSQGDASTSRRFGGTGLGLYICRQLVEAMGGVTGVRSQPGAGATFWVEPSLPAAPAEALNVPETAVGDEAGDLEGLRVLIVEDNPVNMLVVRTLLEGWGVEVVQATDGRQAIVAVERERGRFDAVLMDVHMPAMSGYEATAELRKTYGKDELPIVALTAAALISEQELCLAHGMNDFITKPFEAERLRISLAHWAGQRRQAQRAA